MCRFLKNLVCPFLMLMIVGGVWTVGLLESELTRPIQARVDDAIIRRAYRAAMQETVASNEVEQVPNRAL
ncbi:MAG: hypothetical protein ACREJC_17295 [Tepidisphaeraceae bacterium]